MDSEKSNRLVKPDAYEIRGYRGGQEFNCPQNSRLTGIRLLSNYVFYFNGPFQKFPCYDEIKAAVSLADGTVADTLDELSSLMNDRKITDGKKTFIIINDKDDTTVLKSFSLVKHMTVTDLIDKMAILQKP